MKTILTLFLIGFSALNARQIHSIQDGDWNNGSTWDANGNTPNPQDTVRIYHHVTWNPNNNTVWDGKIYITAYSSLRMTCNNFRYHGESFDIVGSLYIDGDITLDDTSRFYIHNTIDTVKISKIIIKTAILSNFSRTCGNIIMDSIEVHSFALLQGHGFYITQYLSFVNASIAQVEAGYVFLRTCFTTGIPEITRKVKEKDFLNFDILGRQTR